MCRFLSVLFFEQCDQYDMSVTNPHFLCSFSIISNTFLLFMKTLRLFIKDLELHIDKIVKLFFYKTGSVSLNFDENTQQHLRRPRQH